MYNLYNRLDYSHNLHNTLDQFITTPGLQVLGSGTLRV